MIRLAVVLLAFGACSGAEPRPSRRTREPVPAQPAGARGHPAHEHPHGAYPHPRDEHHHHPHPHPHLAGADGHHHPY